jgi:transposase
MDKIEYRAVKKFFVKEGLTANEIYSKFIKAYGDSSPSFSTINKWTAEFKRGRTSLEDDSREGLPKSATTPEIIEQVHDMVYSVALSRQGIGPSQAICRYKTELTKSSNKHT